MIHKGHSIRDLLCLRGWRHRLVCPRLYELGQFHWANANFTAKAPCEVGLEGSVEVLQREGGSKWNSRQREQPVQTVWKEAEDWKALGQAGQPGVAPPVAFVGRKSMETRGNEVGKQVQAPCKGPHVSARGAGLRPWGYGSHGEFLSGREARPTESCLLGTGHTMEGKSVLLGGFTRDFWSFWQLRRDPRSPRAASQSWLGLTIPSPGIGAFFWGRGPGRLLWWKLGGWGRHFQLRWLHLTRCDLQGCCAGSRGKPIFSDHTGNFDGISEY